jgi:hypothetical protein
MSRTSLSFLFKRVESRDGTAKAGVDYVAVNASVTFTADGTKNISIILINTRKLDGSRNFTLTMIFNSSKDHGGISVAPITITDNDGNYAES